MSKINNGGPAFPTTMPLEGWGDPNQGMSLRDWFAGMAIQGMTSNPFWNDAPWVDVAEEAFMAADEMLAAREGKEDA